MDLHFTSFNAEWARAFRRDLTAGLQQRRDFLNKMRNHTFAFLASAARERREAANDFRQRAHRESEGRHLFRSELRSDVHALRSRFAFGLQQMAKELQATSEAFRGASRGGGGASFRRNTGGAAHSASSQMDDTEFTATYDGRDAVSGSRHSKKRHS
ncbi:MAG: hypothetical protein HYY84_04385 [Deltaproteobacteria bacterium]|nr:hypothetical protein [Deltaproteobacteria bacterium]